MFGEEAIQLKAEASGWIIFRYEILKWKKKWGKD